ncbi:hypothetical protein IRJ41_025574, partial [Triplophysa rosa]
GKKRKGPKMMTNATLELKNLLINIIKGYEERSKSGRRDQTAEEQKKVVTRPVKWAGDRTFGDLSYYIKEHQTMDKETKASGIAVQNNKT